MRNQTLKRGLRHIYVWLLRSKRWWRQQDRRWGWWWRGGNIAAALLMLAGVVIPIAQDLWQHDRYALSAEAQQLIGKTDQALLKQLSYDAQTATYRFNASAVTQYDPLAQLKHQVGTASGQGSDKSLYALDVPTDMSKGVTYTDTNSQLAFSLVPQFSAMNGRAEQGHLVFPLAGNAQAIYTLKNNGLKEDIVVPKAVNDAVTFTYQLQLPKTLAVKVIPDGGGAIGIYGPDPSLLGNISYGSSKDRALVEKARENAAKDTLIFGLPAPVVKATDGLSHGATARFVLRGNTLQVVAENLSGMPGAFTIDPSVVVTSASDFATGGNNDGMISFDTTNNQITRDNLTGGGVTGGWTTNATSLMSTLYSFGSVAYNGYLYVLGGSDGSNTLNDVQYAPINANGTIGAWHYTHNSTDDGTTFVDGFTTPRYSLEAVTYNGYLYVMGGFGGGGYLNDVQYAPLNSDGTVGTWQTTTSFTTGRSDFGAATYNGYMYIVGGYYFSGTANYLNDVQYAPINGDGTVGTWQTTTSFTTGRDDAGVVTYNGYLYVMGGYNNGTRYDDVQYASLNSDGTLGTWQATTSLTATRAYFAVVVSNGYMYILGGNTFLNDVQYAPINANGTLGNWQTTSSFTNARNFLGAASANGYLYVFGGHGSSYYNDVQYAKIDPAGINTTFTTSGNGAFPNGNARSYASSAAYNGYLYVLGGSSTASRGSTGFNNVLYAPIDADGTVGTWTVGSTFVSSRVHNDAAAVAYDGYLYLLAGTGTITYSTEVLYAPINSNGSVGTWADTTALSIGRWGPSAWAYNGYMYLAGGYHSGSDTACSPTTSHYCSDVWKATISSTGTLGTWTAQTSTPAGLYDAAVAASGEFVYIMGGDGGSCSQVFVATMADVSGTLSAWNTLNSLATCRTNAMAGIHNGYLYIWGNLPSRSPNINTGEYVKLNANGSFPSDSGCGSRWCSLNSMTASTLGNRTGLLYQGIMYAFGGSTTTTASTAVENSVINNGGPGTAGSWSTTATFTTARDSAASVAYNGYMYMLGGYDRTTNYNDVQYAPIRADGTLGSWQPTASFSNARRSHAAVAYNGYMYILGGYDNTGTYLNDVQYAPIAANGTLGTWQPAASFTTIRSGHVSVAYNGYIYVMGGHNGSTRYNDVQYAPLNANGTVGTWQTTNSFTSPRNAFGGVAYDGYMYIGGGFGNGNYYNDVQYAPINGNGTLGTWNYAASFMNARQNTNMFVDNGHLYLTGGNDASSYYNDVQVAAIDTTGAVEAWTPTTSFATARLGMGSLAYNGYMYILGGFDDTSEHNDVQYATVNSIARVGHYSKLIDLGSAELVSGITFNGSLPAGQSAVSYRAAGADGVFGSPGQLSAITTSGCTGTLAGTRYLFVTITLDDSNGLGTDGAFPEANGINADVTDLTVTYSTGHPLPQNRLRGGQTLQQGGLSPLDTCFP